MCLYTTGIFYTDYNCDKAKNRFASRLRSYLDSCTLAEMEGYRFTLFHFSVHVYKIYKHIFTAFTSPNPINFVNKIKVQISHLKLKYKRGGFLEQ